MATKISIATILAPWEKPYLQEWIDYHLDKGFDVIHLFFHNWEQQDIPTFNDDRVVVQTIYGDKNVQKQFLNYCLHNLTDDWVLFIDLDEFWSGIDPHELVKDKDEFCSIFLQWRFYGDSGQIYNSQNLSVLDRFKWCAEKPDYPSKHLVNMKYKDKLFFNDPHIIWDMTTKKPAKCCYSDGKQVDVIRAIKLQELPVEISHFANKTFPEFIMRKWHQPDVYYGENDYTNDMDKLVKCFQSHNRNEIYKPLS